MEEEEEDLVVHINSFHSSEFHFLETNVMTIGSYVRIYVYLR